MHGSCRPLDEFVVGIRPILEVGNMGRDKSHGFIEGWNDRVQCPYALAEYILPRHVQLRGKPTEPPPCWRDNA